MINSIAATGGFMGMCCGPDKSSELRSTRCLFFFFLTNTCPCVVLNRVKRSLDNLDISTIDALQQRSRMLRQPSSSPSVN